MHYERLMGDFYSEVEYPEELRALIGDAAPWREFCRLPLNNKMRFGYPDDQRAIDPGYKRRFAAEGRDDKEYFHIIISDILYFFL